jgi:hypothetical protein
MALGLTQPLTEMRFKMADGVVSSCDSSHILQKGNGNINEYVCNKCSVYEFQLKEALDELGSARMIIDILKMTHLYFNWSGTVHFTKNIYWKRYDK